MRGDNDATSRSVPIYGLPEIVFPVRQNYLSLIVSLVIKEQTWMDNTPLGLQIIELNKVAIDLKPPTKLNALKPMA